MTATFPPSTARRRRVAIGPTSSSDRSSVHTNSADQTVPSPIEADQFQSLGPATAHVTCASIAPPPTEAATAAADSALSHNHARRAAAWTAPVARRTRTPAIQHFAPRSPPSNNRFPAAGRYASRWQQQRLAAHRNADCAADTPPDQRLLTRQPCHPKPSAQMPQPSSWRCPGLRVL
ncbi:hypothetical protein FN846DRAFT_887954 [Sphaerosporella brunnea]|uniref:Uncharacterized protein n=1 Tax=Sphaerosporella brunnea TaxID=1250544 RepID=A0A5J5F467_9PEZI|nr:hypothetical protein FN846DRAFT_887954 [Sphaerosporella brunnea]